MEFQDKMLKCIDCGADFVFTAGEQLFFHDKQFKNEPKRCKTCKAKRVSVLGAVPAGQNSAAWRLAPPARNAARRPRCPSGPRKAARCFVANVFSSGGRQPPHEDCGPGDARVASKRAGCRRYPRSIQLAHLPPAFATPSGEVPAVRLLRPREPPSRVSAIMRNVPSFYVENFGCRATQADGAAIERQFRDRGLDRAFSPATRTGNPQYLHGHRFRRSGCARRHPPHPPAKPGLPNRSHRMLRAAGARRNRRFARGLPCDRQLSQASTGGDCAATRSGSAHLCRCASLGELPGPR